MLKHWQKWALFAVGVAFVLFAASFFCPAKYEICEHANYSSDENCALYHIGPFVLQSIAQFLSGYSDLVTALSTAFLVIVTLMLVNLGRDQSQTTRAQLRAYVSISAGDPEMHTFVDGNIGIHLKIKNTGATPAYNVRQIVTVDIFPTVLSAPLEDHSEKIPPAGSTVGPNSEVYVFARHARPLTDEDAASLTSQEDIFYIYGKVLYEDVFKVEQTTNFRLTLPVDRNGRAQGVAYAADGNTAT